jgi:hypothetical protein
MQNKMKKLVKPDWHPQWKLMKVISGHLGWVRAIAVDPSNNVLIIFLVVCNRVKRQNHKILGYGFWRLENNPYWPYQYHKRIMYFEVLF